MTSYHGGKQRIGKALAEVIYDVATEVADEDDFEIKGYCEPFCGMLGVYQHIPELFEEHRPKLKYKAGDVNKSVILMWKAAKGGWVPPVKQYTKKQFDKLKYDGRSSPVKGFIGHVHTYRSVYLDGYFAQPTKKIKHSSDKVVSIAKEMKTVSFTSGPYTQFSKLRGYVIYCDPPYADTDSRYYEGIAYSERLTFDSNAFWKWCDGMSEHNIVFVSEYGAPRGVDKVWENGKERLYLV